MPNILQIGFGNFGPTHLAAWRALGQADSLYVADPDPASRARAVSLGLPAARVVADPLAVLDRVDVVDVLAPTDRHFEICQAVVAAGKDMFIEKPMTATLDEAQRLAALIEGAPVLVQIGYYFRFHPLARQIQALVADGRLGRLRYLAGHFHGYKRARADSGVVQNDAVHFIDLANWLCGALPVAVDALTRDHFGRGRDDFALIRLFYPDDALAHIEVGCIQPGRWNDDIVPGATQTKSFTVAGERGAVEVDFQTSELRLHDVHHELIDGLWRPVHNGVTAPHVTVVEPWQVVQAELDAFLASVADRTPPVADVATCGVGMARVVDAVIASSDRQQRVAL